MSGFGVAAVFFGPIARKNVGAQNRLLDFTQYNDKTSAPGQLVKATWSAASTIGLGTGGPGGLAVNLDPAAIARPLAVAGAALVADKIRGIDRPIRPSTARYRAAAARAFGRGAPWALERYGSRRPGAANSDRVFNDSGELAALVRPQLDTANAWRIETVVSGVRNKFVVANLLRRDIPELRSAKELAKHPAIKAALGDGARVAISKPSKRSAAAVFGKRELGGRGSRIAR